MFSRSRPDRDDRLTAAKYWKGRGSRAEYWMIVGFVVLLNILFPGMTTTAMIPVMLVSTTRRLHDFGQTGWWAAGPFAAGLLGGVGMAALPLLAPTLQAVVLVGGVAFTAFVGFMPGDAGPNRFGEPQQRLRRKGPDLGETFS